MPRFSPPCAPRLTDFAKGSCGLEGEAAEALRTDRVQLQQL